MITRRQLLKGGAVGGAALLVPWRVASRAWAAIPGGTLDPTGIEKYVVPLVVPPVMPSLSGVRNSGIDRYAIAVRQFPQQILPAGMPTTTVWGYGSATHRGTFNYPSFTVEARADRPVRVAWINGLVDRNGRYLPHLLPVDPTLHWANPPGGADGRDMHPTFTSTPGPYTGPVPFVTHLHGGHNAEESDGYPEAWYLPHANNIPARYARIGSFYEEFKAKFEAKWHQAWPPGYAVLRDPNRRPGPILQRRRLAVLPDQPRVLRRVFRPLHPFQRHLAHLERGVLREHDGGEWPDLAGPLGGAPSVPIPAPERVQLAVPHPEDRVRCTGVQTRDRSGPVLADR